MLLFAAEYLLKITTGIVLSGRDFCSRYCLCMGILAGGCVSLRGFL